MLPLSTFSDNEIHSTVHCKQRVARKDPAPGIQFEHGHLLDIPFISSTKVLTVRQNYRLAKNKVKASVAETAAVACTSSYPSFKIEREPFRRMVRAGIRRKPFHAWYAFDVVLSDHDSNQGHWSEKKKWNRNSSDPKKKRASRLIYFSSDEDGDSSQDERRFEAQKIHTVQILGHCFCELNNSSETYI